MLKQTCRLATTLISLTLLLSPSAPVMTSTDTLGSKNAQAQVGQTRSPVPCDTTPQRISFSPGSYAETVQPVLTPSCNQANYVVSTRANQLMVLILTSPGAARFQITFPNGSEDGGPVGEGGVIFNKKLPSTGDYRIRISESTMADAWTGKVTLTVVIQ